MQLSYLESAKLATSNAAHLCTSLQFLPPRGRVDFPSPWVLLTPVIAPPTECCANFGPSSKQTWQLPFLLSWSPKLASKKVQALLQEARGHVERGPEAEQTTWEAVGRSIRHLNGKPAPRLQACGWPHFGFSSPGRSQQIPHGAKANQLNWDQPQL